MPIVNFNIKPGTIKLFDQIKGFSVATGTIGSESFELKIANGEEDSFYAGDFAYIVQSNHYKFANKSDEERYEDARKSHLPDPDELRLLINRLNPSHVDDWVKIEELTKNEIVVVSKHPGYFIGKGGSNIKELQRRMKLLGINQRLVLKK